MLASLLAQTRQTKNKFQEFEESSRSISHSWKEVYLNIKFMGFYCKEPVIYFIIFSI